MFSINNILKISICTNVRFITFHNIFQSKYSVIFQTNYSKYELGKINIPISSLIKLSEFYNTSVDYLLGLTNEIKPYSRIK